MKKYCFLTAGLLLAASSFGLAQSQGPSLADIARQTRSGRKPVKMLTDDDMPDRASSAAPSDQNSGDSTSAAKKSDGAPADPKDTKSKEGESKQAVASQAKKEDPATAEIKQKIGHYSEERDAWKKSVSRYESLLQNETSDFRRQTYEEALQQDQHNVDLYQQKVTELQNQLSKTQDAASGDSGAEKATQPVSDHP
ncbi:MAG TPA: hypothetical protein VJN64_15300 [Terriglobales bacterium]|nr:hypothetical protein [Terriglobales bacterium]